jgi:guanylate kinase
MLSYRRIILVGPGSSGKDYASKILQELGLKFSCTYTIRPPRAGEVHGKDYFFISYDEFIEKRHNSEFITEMKFKNGEWLYGRDFNDFYNKENNLIIMAPGDLNQLPMTDIWSSYIVYFCIPEEIRRERLSKRNDADNVERRLEADRKDFKTFKCYNHIITKSDFSKEDLKQIYNNYHGISG